MTLESLMLKLAGGSGSGNFGHEGRPGKHGGSTSKGSGSSVQPPTVNKRSVSEAKKFTSERLASLGYKVKFESTKDGKLRVIDASNPRKPKPTKWHVLPDGRVVGIKKGKIDSEMTDTGIKLVKE